MESQLGVATTKRLNHLLALVALALGLMSTLAAVSIPRPHIRTPVLIGVLWLALVALHAALYWWGHAIRARIGTTKYLLLQAAVIFVLGAAGALYPLAAALYIGLVVEAHSLAGHRIGITPLAILAVVLFSLDAMIVQGAYIGASRGLALLVLVLVVHGVSRLFGRRGTAATTEPIETVPVISSRDSELTQRELQVLRAVARGARSATIAGDLGITERTVKAHLANIYLKLGVESRAAAVAEAMRRGLA
ncbi:MAG TPA: helix-turn-helix transcriptional regulator [Gemmatimonadaceae bacterium]|nr:helix-turn-helix transcriptional regulator [Gemmatimonadaceae bacterium]